MRYQPFSNTYAQARRKFVASATSGGYDLFSFGLDETGPTGEPLFIDAARLGPKTATTILLCVSGTHGAEGFAGSAVQTSWINNMSLSSTVSRDDIAIWMIHAVNPYGFAWQMRNNENNVDLNRNWVSFDKPLPENVDYHKLKPILSSFDGTQSGQQRLIAGLQQYASEVGEAELESTLTQGQYEHPSYPSFGGHEPQFARNVIEQLIQEEMRDVTNVGYIDFHTGTPGIGELLFLCFNPPESKAFAQAQTWWGESHLDKKVVEEKWGGKRPKRHGLMFTGLETAFGSQVNFAGAVVEFGTVTMQDRERPILSMMTEFSLRNAICKKNGITNSSRSNDSTDERNADNLAASQQLLRWSFDRPGDETWEKTVIEKGNWVLDKLWHGLTASPK